MHNLTILKGAEKYYDEYNKKIVELNYKYPDRVRIFDSYEILNDPDQQVSMFKWLGIEGPYDHSITSTLEHQTQRKKISEIVDGFQG